MHLSPEPSPHHIQTPRPRDPVRNRIVLLQIVLRKPGIHALVRIRRVLHLRQQSARADTRRDALGDELPAGLYAEDFGAAHNVDRLVLAAALGEVHDDAERGGHAAPRVRDRGRVVGDEGAEFAGGCFGLREDVEADGCGVAEGCRVILASVGRGCRRDRGKSVPTTAYRSPMPMPSPSLCRVLT